MPLKKEVSLSPLLWPRNARSLPRPYLHQDGQMQLTLFMETSDLCQGQSSQLLHFYDKELLTL